MVTNYQLIQPYNEEIFIITREDMILAIFIICLLSVGEGSRRVVLSTGASRLCESPSVRITLRDSRTRNNVPLKAIFVHIQGDTLIYIPRGDMRVNVGDLHAAVRIDLLSTKMIVIKEVDLQFDFRDGDRLEYIYDFSQPFCTLF
jgi:hypothetical protein